MSNEQEIFAVDIGTRTIVGIVLCKQNTNFKILGYEMIEHGSRAMYDGQIHDIEAVANSLTKIKNSLEKKLNKRFNKVAVAAAGRALYTVETEATKKVSAHREITEQDIRNLEMEAISNATDKASGEKGSEAIDSLYCVGYSVINWLLEDEKMENLLGQKGQSISVKLVATFLPRVVIESLISVIKRCELELYSITLEPIAASSVVMLPGMRKLNIALVDIGAGTSDIALSQDGSIYAYGMVPMAGDEITEKICETYLLDFDEGERVKKQLTEEGNIKFQDILCQVHELEAKEIRNVIKPVIAEISSNIAHKILELNKKIPAAVLCIGGGSLMPDFTEFIANHLELSRERVGVRTKESLSFIKGGEGLSGPIAITPIGIAINALEGNALSFIKVFIEDKIIHILGQDKPTVLKALVCAGYKSSQIFGKPGMALTFTLNGKIQIVKGEMATPGVITMNGKNADFDDIVHDGAVINLKPPIDGSPAKAKIKDFVSCEYETTIYINDRELKIKPQITMNNVVADLEEDISDDAVITMKKRELILSDLFEIICFKPEDTKGKLVMKVNGMDAGFATRIKDGDNVKIYWKSTK